MSDQRRTHRLTFRYREGDPSLQVTLSSYDQTGARVGMVTWTPGPFESLNDIHEEAHRLMARAEQLELLSD